MSGSGWRVLLLRLGATRGSGREGRGHGEDRRRHDEARAWCGVKGTADVEGWSSVHTVTRRKEGMRELYVEQWANPSFHMPAICGAMGTWMEKDTEWH